MKIEEIMENEAKIMCYLSFPFVYVSGALLSNLVNFRTDFNDRLDGVSAAASRGETSAIKSGIKTRHFLKE